MEETNQDKRASVHPHGSAAGYVRPTIPIEMLEMLEDTQMLDLHEDNGPGRVGCPVCGESITMRWNWGKRLDSPDEIKHHVFCPVGWAKKRRNDACREAASRCQHTIEQGLCGEAVCVKCNEDLGWYCPSSREHVCEYTDVHECCVYCGQPEERQ